MQYRERAVLLAAALLVGTIIGMAVEHFPTTPH